MLEENQTSDLSQLETIVFGGRLKESLESPIKEESKKKKAAWVDKDDETMVQEVSKKRYKVPKKFRKDLPLHDQLVKNFTSMHSRPEWAEKKHEGYDSDDEYDAFVGDHKEKNLNLDKDILNFKKCSDINLQCPSKHIIKSIQFHPTCNTALVADRNDIMNLFIVDGETNPKLQSVHFENFFLDKARFDTNGEDVIISSRFAQGYYHKYNLKNGKVIKIPFVNGRTKYSLKNFVLSSDDKFIACQGEKNGFNLINKLTNECIDELKLNGTVSALLFSLDSRNLFAFGKEGIVYVYDMRNRTFVHSFRDKGSFGGSCLGLSPNEKYFVTGSESGVVNIYSYDKIMIEKEPEPLKVIQNIRGLINCFKFNHTSELMFMSSSFSPNAFRCIHFPSLTVYSNFPLANFLHAQIQEGDISPNSGFLAMANNKGSAYLYRLNHFSKY